MLAFVVMCCFMVGAHRAECFLATSLPANLSPAFRRPLSALLDGPASVSIDVDGGHYSTPEQLAELSPNVLFDTFVTLIAENRSLKSKLPFRERTGQEYGSEIPMRLKSDVASLKQKIADLQRENDALAAKVAALVVDNKRLTAEVQNQGALLMATVHELKALQFTLTAREVGSLTDIAIRQFIFPKASSRPFYIRSLKILRSFLMDPAITVKLGRCGERAWDEFNKLDPNEQVAIKQRMESVFTATPDIIEALDDLKEAWSVAHPQVTDFDELLNFFQCRGDDGGREIYDALTLVRGYFEKTAFAGICKTATEATESE